MIPTTNLTSRIVSPPCPNLNPQQLVRTGQKQLEPEYNASTVQSAELAATVTVSEHAGGGFTRAGQPGLPKLFQWSYTNLS